MGKNNMMTTQLMTILTLLISVQVQAFHLEPMIANFTQKGEGATKIFRVENEAKEKVAVKIQAYVREIDENGKEKLTETKDFKIYPEQVVLEASDSRAIRVLYLGNGDLEKEAAYRITATQLPVTFGEEKKGSGVKFLFQYVASAYVTSDKYYPKLQVESISKPADDMIKIKIINKGQKHALLSKAKIELTDVDGKKLKLDKDLIKTWDTENILSGTRRTFKVKSNQKFDLTKNPPVIQLREEN